MSTGTIIALCLYASGAFCVAVIFLFLVCLGGQAPRLRETLLGIATLVFWPIAIPLWLVRKLRKTI